MHSWLTEGVPGSAKSRQPICEGKCHRPASLSAIAYTPTTAWVLVFTSLSLYLYLSLSPSIPPSFSIPFFPSVSSPTPSRHEISVYLPHIHPPLSLSSSLSQPPNECVVYDKGMAS